MGGTLVAEVLHQEGVPVAELLLQRLTHRFGSVRIHSCYSRSLFTGTHTHSTLPLERTAQKLLDARKTVKTGAGLWKRLPCAAPFDDGWTSTEALERACSRSVCGTVLREIVVPALALLGTLGFHPDAPVLRPHKANRNVRSPLASTPSNRRCNTRTPVRFVSRSGGRKKSRNVATGVAPLVYDRGEGHSKVWVLKGRL